MNNRILFAIVILLSVNKLFSQKTIYLPADIKVSPYIYYEKNVFQSSDFIGHEADLWEVSYGFKQYQCDIASLGFRFQKSF